jgi:hypothetical protein
VALVIVIAAPAVWTMALIMLGFALLSACCVTPVRPAAVARSPAP